MAVGPLLGPGFHETFELAIALSLRLSQGADLHRQGVLLIGIDTPSVDLFDSKDLPAHQMFLRHENIATTMKYAHANRDDLRKALNQVAESRKKPRKRGVTRQKSNKRSPI